MCTSGGKHGLIYTLYISLFTETASLTGETVVFWSQAAFCAVRAFRAPRGRRTSRWEINKRVGRDLYIWHILIKLDSDGSIYNNTKLLVFWSCIHLQDGQYAPASHSMSSVRSVEPRGHIYPLKHARHVLLPSFGWYIPPGQGSGADDFSSQ